jgi:hypothetical protein
MGQPISSAEPEKLFRYSDFGMQLDHDLTVEAARLAATLQHFEATCTEPGFQVGVGHLAGDLRGHAGQNESVDSWVRQVGQGFQMADWVWSGTVPWPGTIARTAWPLPGWTTTTISIPTLLPLVSIPGWLARLTPSLPWLRPGLLRDVTEFLDDLLKPIKWASGHKKAARVFRETLKQVGRILNSLTGKRGYVKLMKELGDVLTGTAKVVSAGSDLFALKDFKRYFAGEITNQEVARTAVEALVPVPFIDNKIADWVAKNVPDPNGKWRGLISRVE